MTGPGEYVPDVTEGITRVEELPKPRLERRSRNWPARPCPRCRHRAGRYAVGRRTLHDLGDAQANRPVDLVVTFSRHRCKLTRGLPQLRTLREIMEEVYRLFDRRCKTETALKKLERLRRRVRRFKKLGKTLNKLKSPTLEKALVFLDDRLLGATSNAVERSNRRFRKAQKSIYSVRTKEHVEERLALDMQREQRTRKRQQTVKTLHRARSKPGSLH